MEELVAKIKRSVFLFRWSVPVWIIQPAMVVRSGVRNYLCSPKVRAGARLL